MSRGRKKLSFFFFFFFFFFFPSLVSEEGEENKKKKFPTHTTFKTKETKSNPIEKSTSSELLVFVRYKHIFTSPDVKSADNI